MGLSVHDFERGKTNEVTATMAPDFHWEALSGPQYRLKLSMVASLNSGDRNENLEGLR